MLAVEIKESILKNLMQQTIGFKREDFIIQLFENTITTFLNTTNYGSPLAYNIFAVFIREFIGTTLHIMSPDEEVRSCAWFVPIVGGNTDISREHRMKYAIQKGLSNEFVEETLNLEIEESNSQLKKCINQLNKYTHVREKTYNVTQFEGDKMVKEVLEKIDDFFKLIINLHNEIIYAYEDEVQSKFWDLVDEEILNDIDIMSTQHRYEGFNVNQIKVQTMTSKFIEIDIQGSVELIQQYGSNRDVSRGDGVVIESSYPFNLVEKIDINNPLLFEVNENTLKIDTSSFYE